MKYTQWFMCCMALFLIIVPSSYAYDKDLHYGLVYYLARQIGYDQDTAYTIAATSEYVDEHKWTLPSTSADPQGMEQRRLYHFPMHHYLLVQPYAQRNSMYSQFNIYKGVRDKNLIKFGMALHVFQDSWSHESFEYSAGHLFYLHEPDRPYLYVNKALEMSGIVYQTLIDFYTVYYGKQPPHPATLDSLKEFLTKMFQFKPSPIPNDYDEEIEVRYANWIANWGYGPIGFNRILYENAHKTEYETQVNGHCIPAGDFPYPYKMSTPENVTATPIVPVPPTVSDVPYYADFPKIIEENSGNDPIRFADYLLSNGGEYLMFHPDAKKILGTEEGIQRLMERVTQGSDPVAVFGLIEKSGGPSDLKKQILHPYLSSASMTARLVAASQLYHLGDTDAAPVLLEAANTLQSNDISQQALILMIMPRSEIFNDAVEIWESPSEQVKQFLNHPKKIWISE